MQPAARPEGATEAPAWRVAHRLNRRFQAGRPSNDLGQAGVLVHVVDYTEHEAEPWRPCEGCAHANRVAASLAYGRMVGRGVNGSIPLFASGTRGGVIVRPGSARLRCSYPGDGRSRFKSDGCIGGCIVRGCHARTWCSPVAKADTVALHLRRPLVVPESEGAVEMGARRRGRRVVLGNSTEACARPQAEWLASKSAAACQQKAWPPAKLQQMLAALEEMARPVGPCGPAYGRWSETYSEMVLNSTHWPLPAVIEAFFYPMSRRGACCAASAPPDGSSGCLAGCVPHIRAIHANFTRRFRSAAVPLLTFHVDAWERPFRAAPPADLSHRSWAK